MLDFSNDPVGSLDVKPLVRLYYFFCQRMNPIHCNMNVKVGCIDMGRHNGLMVFQAHAIQKNVHSFSYLFSGGSFVFLP